MRKVLVALVLAVCVMAGLAVPLLAADGGLPEIPGVADALALLAQGVGVGVVLSFLAERSAGFQALQPEVKGKVIFGLSVGLPVLAQLLLQFVPVDVWATVEPFWRALAAGFVGWASGQAAYAAIIKPAKEQTRTLKVLE